MLIKKTHNFSNVNLFKLLITLFIMLWMLQASIVWAHTSLVKSDPPRRASLSESPAQVQLWFNEEIEVAYASVEIFNSNGEVIATDKTKAVEDDPKSVVVDNMPVLIPGSYKVQYRVLSVDGHVVESDYSFRIKK